MLPVVPLWFVALVPILGGLQFGCGIGFVPSYTAFQEVADNCTLYRSQAACETVLRTGKCQWNATNESGACSFVGLECAQFASVHKLCVANESHGGICFFDYDAQVCRNVAGFDALQQGVFAGALIVGVLSGAWSGGVMLTRAGYDGSLVVGGAAALVGSALVHVSAGTSSFTLLIIGRVLYGLGCGLCCVACPSFVDRWAPEQSKERIGSLFQVSITFGIALIAGLGLVLNPTNFDVDVLLERRMQGYVALPTLSSVGVLFLGVLVHRRRNQLRAHEDNAAVPILGVVNQVSAPRLVSDKSGATEEEVETTFSSMRRPLAVGVVVAAAAQLTGINAIMNFAPSITQRMGVPPLLGNFLIMLWNFVTTLAAIPLAQRVSMTRLYLVGVACVSVACLCTGIPVYPGVASTEVKQVVGTLGVAFVIAAFEVGIGPPFWVLTQQLFPPSFKATGSSFVTTILNLFNLIINVGFPISVQAISGGPSADQDKGMAVTFLIFGGIGCCAFFVLAKTLRTYP